MRLLLLALTLFSPIALACQPCNEYLDLKSTIQQADLIAIVESRGSFFESQPETVDLKVKDILKGSYKHKRLKARAWHGMCPYGVILEEGTHLIFLEENGSVFASVQSGCSIKSLTVQQGKVLLKGEFLSIAEFKDRYRVE